MRVVAVDWSGRKLGAERHIYLAVGVADRLLSLEAGRRREQVADHLIELALEGPDLAIGIDFGFSLPVWFLDLAGFESGMDIPEAVTEGWLRQCPPPFWGRCGHHRGPEEPQHRRTENGVRPPPKSIFQIGGAGAVGTGSLRGFAALARLRREGFSIWPFDAPRTPMVVEIFPRLLTGAVVKSNHDERERYLRQRDMPPEGARNEDAFDAEVSALVMGRHLDELIRLKKVTDPVILREGWIWAPAHPVRPCVQ